MLQAAPPRIKAPKRVASSRVSSFTRTPKIPRYGGTCGAVMGANYCSLEAKVITTSNTPNIKRHTWITRQVRRFQAWQLKKERQRHLSDLKTRERINKNLELARASLPALVPERQFTVGTLADYTPTLQSLENIPLVPFIEEPKVIAYRGLALPADGEAIRNILINGMRTQDVSTHSGTFLRALSAGNRETLRQLSTHPIINVTSKPSKASFWGKLRSVDGKCPILAIVKMKGNFQGKSVEFVTQDIPASQIEEMVVLLNIDNNLTWCKVHLNTDNTLMITPYNKSSKLN